MVRIMQSCCDDESKRQKANCSAYVYKKCESQRFCKIFSKEVAVDEWKNEAPGLPPEAPHELLEWEGAPGM